MTLRAGGRFALDLDYFRHWTGEISMSWDSGEPAVPDVYTERADRSARSGARARRSRSKPATRTSRHRCSACSKSAPFTCCAACTRAFRSDTLCLAGGCAMNSVANGKIRQQHAVQRTCSSSRPRATTAPRSARRSKRGTPAATGRSAPRMAHSYWGTEYRRGRDRRGDPRQRASSNRPTLHVDDARR